MSALDTTSDPGFGRSLAKLWWLVALLGAALVVIGILLLANLAGAAFTLAILVGIGMIISGIDEIVQADRHVRRWPSWLLGALWIVVGVVAFAWPGVTLWALAVVFGIGLLITGVLEIFFAIRMRREMQCWYWALITGALAVVAGVMSLAWPDATVLVLAVLLGIYVLLRGLATLMFAFGLRSLAKL